MKKFINKKKKKYKKKYYKIFQKHKLTVNKTALIGLIPFAYIAIYYNSLTALTILINGIIFHSRFLDYDIMIYIDTIVNAILIVSYIIISKFDLFLIFTLGIGSSIFIYTNFMTTYFKKNYFLNNVFHVIFVQGFSALSLTKFYLYH
tara:strand:+ start:171 stop:611 length:441 start_codon:yes stop_codon:yes gene_type:complete